MLILFPDTDSTAAPRIKETISDQAVIELLSPQDIVSHINDRTDHINVMYTIGISDINVEFLQAVTQWTVFSLKEIFKKNLWKDLEKRDYNAGSMWCTICNKYIPTYT